MPGEAKAPFNNAKADIILCSSDNVYFRVFRCMLALSSPFFEAMFDLPRPSTDHCKDEMFDGLDVIWVSENSRTLDMLLRFCYPAAVKDPGLEDINDVEQVLEAAMKYGMEDVEERVRKAMVTPSLLESSPVRVLAIACRFSLNQKPGLRHDIRFITQPQHMTPLLQNTFLITCGQAARTLCDNLDWLKKSQTHSFYEWWTNCCPCNSKADVRYLIHGTYPREWWADYMDKTSIALEESPCGAVLTKNLEEAVERANGCPSCRRRAQDQMVHFTKTFARELDRVIAEITLDIAI
ncbi:hypothetical protein EV424DRAFT_1341447 [Suillus variegatus]|nr:hypothetical protein EV424DRAFT_1341447 [Suillus variegatus]